MISKTERVVNYVVLTVMALLVLFPIGTFLLAAVSPDRSGKPVGLAQFRWENFATAWRDADFSRAMTVRCCSRCSAGTRSAYWASSATRCCSRSYSSA
jgi:ABC-type glycerol-3-phosphate transport system permease component